MQLYFWYGAKSWHPSLPERKMDDKFVKKVMISFFFFYILNLDSLEISCVQ